MRVSIRNPESVGALLQRFYQGRSEIKAQTDGLDLEYLGRFLTRLALAHTLLDLFRFNSISALSIFTFAFQTWNNNYKNFD